MVYYAANATLRLGVLPNWLFGNGQAVQLEPINPRGKRLELSA
jgi:hypothetical protein